MNAISTGCLRRAPARSVLLLAAAALSGCVFAPGYGLRYARVVGATETIRVIEADLDFLARVDTGAVTTSIHAVDLEIASPEPDMERNVGKTIRFLVVNEDGRSARITSRIADVTQIRSSQGSEARYTVPLRLRWRGIEKELLINLRDRTPMSYKLLVGRDWIGGDFLVDVDRNARD